MRAAKSIIVFMSFSAMTYSLETPTLLQCVATDSNVVQIAWRDNSLTESGFVVSRADDLTGGFFAVDTTGANQSFYTDSTVHSDGQYHYYVSAFSATENSANSETLSVSTPQYTPPPPVYLSVTDVSAAWDTANSKVTISFYDSNTAETGYKIIRFADFAANEVGSIASSAPDQTGSVNWTDTNVEENRCYIYAVNTVADTGEISSESRAAIYTFAQPTLEDVDIAHVSEFSAHITQRWAGVIGDTFFMREDIVEERDGVLWTVGNNDLMFDISNPSAPAFLGVLPDSLRDQYTKALGIWGRSSICQLPGFWQFDDCSVQRWELDLTSAFSELHASHEFNCQVLHGTSELKYMARIRDVLLVSQDGWWNYTGGGGDWSYFHFLNPSSLNIMNSTDRLDYRFSQRKLFADSNYIIIDSVGVMEITNPTQLIWTINRKIVDFFFPYVFAFADSSRIAVYDIREPSLNTPIGELQAAGKILNVVFNQKQSLILICLSDRVQVFRIGVSLEHYYSAVKRDLPESLPASKPNIRIICKTRNVVLTMPDIVGISQCRIFDCRGRIIVDHFERDDNRITLGTKSLAKGLYTIQVSWKNAREPSQYFILHML